jgi:ketosteroid isomerase-like protein
MKPKDVLKAWHEAFVRKDVDALCNLYAEDAVNHQVAEAPLYGKEAIRESFVGFFKAFPNERTEVLNTFEDGEWAIWEWIGGPKDKSDDEASMHGCGFFRIQNGKIIFQRGYWDKLTFLKTHSLSLQSIE